MVTPGVGFRGGTLFRSKNSKNLGEDQKKEKGLRRKISEFLVQMRIRIKQRKVFTTKRWSCGFTS